MTNSELVEMLSEYIISAPVTASGRKIVAICGWAATGKSTVSHQICERLRSSGITADCISTDSFLIDRAIRKARGVSGYNPNASDSAALEVAIRSIADGVKFEYQKYDSKAGRPSGPMVRFGAVDVALVEGVRSFDPAVFPFADLSVAICVDASDMNSLRVAANLVKCGLDATEATQRLELERSEFDEFVAPSMKDADIVFRVNSRYEYLAEL